MENKYYTPDISEFHIGFECESTNNKKEWFKFIFEQYNFTILDLELLNSMYRVKYLNKEDIISLGWEAEYVLGNENKVAYYKKNQYWLYYNTETTKLTIVVPMRKLRKGDFIPERVLVDKIHIKNKSELKVLLKQLNIK